MKIAIVGVAAQLPSGDFSANDLGYRTFWDFLVAGGQAYQPLNANQFASSEFKVLQKDLELPAKGAFLKNHDEMDSTALGISINDARVMPFSARHLMELSFEALTDSGINYRRQRVGCFMTCLGSFEIPGGVNTRQLFRRGEGVTVVVIKPLDDALRDGDHIYSVILGSFINSTGSLMPLHVPSAVAQKECILGAYARAGKRPTDADFAELHITGTSVGDRIETTAAGEIFSQNLDVGTVKGNIGHLETAAFLASLLKACLILENKYIPPTVNLSVPSPAIQWDQYRLSVPTAMKPLGCRSDSGQSIISLSSAGIGGSTGHVVIESPPARKHKQAQPWGSVSVTFVVGALSPKALARISQRIRDDSSPPPLSLSPSGWPVTITVAAIAMLQMALFDLLISAGVMPNSFAGHSAGETAIIYASGAGSKAMALEIAIARGQAMTVTESVDVGMASLGCSADVAKQLISRLSGNIEISCFNAPDSVAISGSADLLAEAISLAQAQGIFAQRLRTMVPGHSSYMDKIKEDYMERMNDIFTRYLRQHIPKVPVFSTCTGQVRVDEFSPIVFLGQLPKSRLV
ncbi:Polyketide synthase [Mycena sanguinolenta]|uniref:Polyketide synthase n=1 Tax=Mycena sanguinolenta TaxID=230812 RepID=A0A8H7D437_9AGAR|nr:Polyketide synthase [Mycena sanguinolenta]